jgi:tRNA 2-selenouridine synthase
VLDLEMLAAHRGSLLGALPDQPQPPQKSFESAIWSALSGFDPARPVFVESESKKIGALRVPEALITAMHASHCVRLEVPLAARVQLLREEYPHFLRDPETLNTQLAHLARLRGTDTVAAWQALASQQAWDQLVATLLEQHYDPAYLKSLSSNYASAPDTQTFRAEDVSVDALQRLARDILAAV